MIQASLLINNISELATPIGSEQLKGKAMHNSFNIIDNAALAIHDKQIVWLGPESKMPSINAATVIDAKGQAVIPGFVDSHTHFVFAGYRADEFLWRVSGIPYMEIHNRGGGIASTVKATRLASESELLEISTQRLKTMLELGVTTVEGKSGYGLDMDTELLQLKVMKKLNTSQPVDIITTFMGAHSIPYEYNERGKAYIEFIINEVLPKVKELKLAKFCDVFCEKGVFELDDTRRLLLAAKQQGFGLKLHADEIVRIGGAGLSAELGAISADHLLKASKPDLQAMSKAGVVATCLPLTAFSLREPYADARSMIDLGLAVALASDFNPGSCYSQAMPLLAALGLLHMNMTSQEVLTAMTLNGAAALGLARDRGSIEVGKLADVIILKAPSYKHLMYNIGMNLVGTVIKNGKPVVG